MNTTVHIKYEYKITPPPPTYVSDIFWWKKGKSLLTILLKVDKLSWKAFAYVLIKSIKGKKR
jgi:REP element-mobilizing transposase RayT